MASQAFSGHVKRVSRDIFGEHFCGHYILIVDKAECIYKLTIGAETFLALFVKLYTLLLLKELFSP